MTHFKDGDPGFISASSFPRQFLHLVLLTIGLLGFLFGMPKEGSTSVLSAFFAEVNNFCLLR
jgi:hypothetical protein